MVISPLPVDQEASLLNENDGDVVLGDDWDLTFERRELREDRVFAAAERINGHGKEATFYLRALHSGEYHLMPTLAFMMYDPSHRGASGELLLRVVEANGDEC